MKLMVAYMDCDLCRKMTSLEDLEWIVMNNKELNIRMYIKYGTHKQACKECREKFNLPIWNRPKKVSISVLRNTRDVLRRLKEELSNSKNSRNMVSYDGLLTKLIRKAGYGDYFKELYAKLHDLDKDLINESDAFIF